MTRKLPTDETQAPGHFGNRGPEGTPSHSHRADREERLQRTRDQAPDDSAGQLTARPGGRKDTPEGLRPGLEPSSADQRAQKATDRIRKQEI